MNTKDELTQCKKELAILQEEYVKLQISCGRKQRVIDTNLAIEILDHINESNSLTETAKKFDYAPEELFYSIPEWDDCNERLYGLSDYLVYSNRLEGRCNEIDIIDNLKDNKKMRTPDSDELEFIFSDYKKRTHSLYELADKYDLLIHNLFRLLKEGGLIKSESDAFGYNEFYKEYVSEKIYNSYNIDTDLKLIDMFYKYKK